MKNNAHITEIEFNHVSLDFHVGITVGGRFVKIEIDQFTAKQILQSFEESTCFEVSRVTQQKDRPKTFYTIVEK